MDAKQQGQRQTLPRLPLYAALTYRGSIFLLAGAVIALSGSLVPTVVAAQRNEILMPVLPPCQGGGLVYRDIARARDRGVPESRYTNRPQTITGVTTVAEKARARQLIHEVYSHPAMSPDEAQSAYVKACQRLVHDGVIPPDPTTLLGH